MQVERELLHDEEQRQRDDRKSHGPRPQRDPRDRQRREGDARADDRECVERVVAGADAEVLECDPRRVRPDAEERRLAERDVPGEPGEEIPRNGERGVHQRQHADVDEPRLWKHERERDARRGEGAAADETAAGHSARSRTPKIPCGRMSRKTSRTTKYEKDAHVGFHSTATTASVTPMRSDARTAPARLPRPPSTTIERSREIRS